MGWLIAAGVLFLLAIMPVGISAVYNTHGPVARLIVGPVKIRIYPTKQKEPKDKPEQKKEKTKASAQKTQPKEEKGGSFKDFMPLLSSVIELLSDFRRKLRVNRLEMKLVMAADDPCDLAVNYGKAWAALGNLMPHLERLFVIKKRDLEVECDFTANTTLIFVRVDLTITIGRLLSMAAVHGIGILRKYLNIIKLRKGGAKQ